MKARGLGRVIDAQPMCTSSTLHKFNRHAEVDKSGLYQGQRQL